MIRSRHFIANGSSSARGFDGVESFAFGLTAEAPTAEPPVVVCRAKPDTLSG
jgi:hypothetical protein